MVRRYRVTITIGPGSSIDPTSVIGLASADVETDIRIDADVQIGAFCVIEAGAKIGAGVEISHHCVVGRDAIIGARSKLVDSVRVARSARVGSDCIIGGNVSDRAILEDRVTFMGEMAHSHRDATIEWGIIEEESPCIREGSVIAQGAWVVGGISIGPNSYVSIGEIVKTDVPPNTVVIGGRYIPLTRWRGLIRTRGSDPQSSRIAGSGKAAERLSTAR